MAALRVLVVEDSPVQRQLMEGIIQGDRELELVGAAGSGEEALELVESLRPDLVIMDVVLPGMDGLEATRRILARSPTRILVVTAFLDQPHLNLAFEALRAGALDVLPAPRASDRVSHERLLARMREVGRRVPPPGGGAGGGPTATPPRGGDR